MGFLLLYCPGGVYISQCSGGFCAAIFASHSQVLPPFSPNFGCQLLNQDKVQLQVFLENSSNFLACYGHILPFIGLRVIVTSSLFLPKTRDLIKPFQKRGPGRQQRCGGRSFPSPLTSHLPKWPRPVTTGREMQELM